ncbi:hypothetical protein SVAN01_06130 [Stagonosporopsis vannaccii]|nr:hypothetical protein SVAN01_06130 [Stagonosporopsis vannaccii]
MSSQLFDAQLHVPDNNASNKQLFKLIAAGKFTGRGLPDVAHKYLDAFCNRSYSNGRRRWFGIALVGMMRASASVIERLKKLSRGTSQIGATILNREETEECRIVAGLIIRQGLEAGIDFADFWASSKFPDSVPNFPRDFTELWMSQLQTYLDTLSDLALADLNSDAVVLYPIALASKDGFQWAGRSAIALIEKDVLTMVIPDFELTRLQFLDIPLGYITGMSLQQVSPCENQEGRSGHKMYTLMMRLRRGLPNYQLDTSDHTTPEFKVSFELQGDAKEFQRGLEDACKNLGTIATNGADIKSMHLYKNNGLRCSDSSSVHLPGEPAPSEPAPFEQSRQKENLTQRSSQENGRGKLPSVSRATKQKAVRARQLPSGVPNAAKSRAAKSAAPVVEESENEDESDGSSQDEYDLNSTARSRKSVSNVAVKKSQGRRKTTAEDEEFVPNGSKTRLASTKRKRGSSDAAEQIQPAKRRAQTKSSNVTRPLATRTTTKKQKASEQETAHLAPGRAREPTMQSAAQQNIQNVAASRHPLIERLKSKSPSKIAAPMFKKPGQPASTPGRPKSKAIRITPRPQTPHDTRKDFEDLPAYNPASTPRSQSIHEEDFGVGYTPIDTEILSSNTKRVPDSPHAESTAISGHADQDDVHREKRRGDLETAKSDPFRGEGQRLTTFTRKLTAESCLEGGAGHDGHRSLLGELLSDDLEVDDPRTILITQPLSKHSPSLFKHRVQSHLQSHAQHTTAQTKDFAGPSAHAAEHHKVDTTLNHASRSLTFEPTRGVRASQTNTPTHRRTAPMNRSSPNPVLIALKERRTPMTPANEPAELNHSDLLDAQEAIVDALPDAPQREAHAVGPDGETTLVGEDDDMPEQHTAESRDLRFRSSPPIPDSSSARDISSDNSQPEPELSPPTSRADELEWEDALQPHQRDLHEQLLRTSKRVIRHIVDNETAVTDIAGVFANDGERILNLMLERQNNESAEAFRTLARKKQDLLKELSDASKNLKQQRKELRAAE